MNSPTQSSPLPGNSSALLRKALASSQMLVAPGAYDAIGARMIMQAGFKAAYMTGAGTSAARGFPDFGLLSFSEMVDNAGAMAQSVDIPLIADADTGYGNELNVTRTVREYEARGVAAIHIEDQVAPKRCGHLDGKQVVSRQEFVSKIRAAAAARRTSDFYIIARTDALSTLDFDEAIWRGNAALDAGADMAFVEAPRSLEELERVPKLIAGPCLLNVVPGGRTPIISMKDAQRMGYKLAIHPALMLMAVLEAGDVALAQLRDTGFSASAAGPISEMFRRFGADEWEPVRTRFNDPAGV
ncbi:MAG: carboxyvinyl-carboxyphosphonate phosphorylmutase [Betaproteobacteria bacterium]|nr:carboxyvinyl-carboxyphosphonate phosphorylmutase [Betaproteobacteria bacterium]